VKFHVSGCALAAALWTVVLGLAPARGDTLAHWTFNTNPSDSAPNTGTLLPEQGFGTITLVGGTSQSFAQGSGSDTSATATADNNNSSLETKSYPGPFDGNKTAGIQIAVNTTGFQDVVLSFEHRHSEGASARFQIQYSSDGVNFTDGADYTSFTANVFNARGEDYGAVAALDDNPNVTFRIVAEFMNESPGGNYVGTSGNYVSNADSRFDVVTITATPIPEPAGAVAVVLLAGSTLARRRRQPNPVHER
jgi:hypothetical protein